jgi:hypothetical protein
MTEMQTVPLVGVLLGNAETAAESALIAAKHLECPYCVSYWSAGRTVMGLFSIPPEYRWWLQWVADDPQGTLGLRRAEVFFTDKIGALSPWARGGVKPELVQAPCGAQCPDCPKYRKECRGCPSTQYYLAGQPSSK